VEQRAHQLGTHLVEGPHEFLSGILCSFQGRRPHRGAYCQFAHTSPHSTNPLGFWIGNGPKRFPKPDPIIVTRFRTFFYHSGLIHFTKTVPKKKKAAGPLVPAARGIAAQAYGGEVGSTSSYSE